MTISEQVQELMKQAIKAHPKAKLWAEVNCERNFVLVTESTAYNSLMDFVVAGIDDRDILNWFNELCRTKLNSFVLEVCREMYYSLRNET